MTVKAILQRVSICIRRPGASEACVPVSEQEFDRQGREVLLRECDERGQTRAITAYDYDAQGNLERQTVRDARGKITRQIDYRNSYSGDTLLEVGMRLPDGRERQIVHGRDADGGHSETTYEGPARRYVEKKRFDRDGRLIERFAENGGLCEEHRYDAHGELQEVVQHFSAEPASTTIRYRNIYDAEGRLSEVEMNGRPWRTRTYDDQRRLARETWLEGPANAPTTSIATYHYWD